MTLLSNHTLNRIITDIHKIVKVDCSVWSKEGKCIVSTGQEEDRLQANIDKFIQADKDEKITKRGAFFWIRDDGNPIYVLVFHENMENASVSGQLCVCQFENLIQATKMRTDKNQFYQNLLLDNLLLVDIINQAKKMNVDTEARRVVFVIEPKEAKENLALETIRGLYATGTKDYVTSVDENHIIYIKNLEKTEDYKDLSYTAKTIVNVLNTEIMINVRVAYGMIAEHIKDVSKSYKEATMALDVGKVFYTEREIFAYNELGIGRLIHQLPSSLCEMFLKEVFTEKAYAQLDKETLHTVNLFFENGLNISETARKMYLHRNTLVYRLEKIQKITGLDVRVFDDALTFKIAMMVTKHMKAQRDL